MNFPKNRYLAPILGIMRWVKQKSKLSRDSFALITNRGEILHEVAT